VNKARQKTHPVFIQAGDFKLHKTL